MSRKQVCDGHTCLRGVLKPSSLPPLLRPIIMTRCRPHRNSAPGESRMAIKFSCPNCGKALVRKDQLAGKRGACSGCKKVITIPFPVAEAHHENVEALAMQAFAEEPAAAAAPVETKTIEFECPMCNAKVQVTADLEGKRTPCPDCGR